MADVESINHFFSITCDRQFSFAVTQLFSQVIGVNGNMSCVAGPLCFSHVLDLPALQLHSLTDCLEDQGIFFCSCYQLFLGWQLSFFMVPVWFQQQKLEKSVISRTFYSPFTHLPVWNWKKWQPSSCTLLPAWCVTMKRVSKYLVKECNGQEMFCHWKGWVACRSNFGIGRSTSGLAYLWLSSHVPHSVFSFTECLPWDMGIV